MRDIICLVLRRCPPGALALRCHCPMPERVALWAECDLSVSHNLPTVWWTIYMDVSDSLVPTCSFSTKEISFSIYTLCFLTFKRPCLDHCLWFLPGASWTGRKTVTQKLSLISKIVFKGIKFEDIFQRLYMSSFFVVQCEVLKLILMIQLAIDISQNDFYLNSASEKNPSLLSGNVPNFLSIRVLCKNMLRLSCCNFEDNHFLFGHRNPWWRFTLANLSRIWLSSV